METLCLLCKALPAALDARLQPHSAHEVTLFAQVTQERGRMSSANVDCMYCSALSKFHPDARFSVFLDSDNFCWPCNTLKVLVYANLPLHICIGRNRRVLTLANTYTANGINLPLCLSNLIGQGQAAILRVPPLAYSRDWETKPATVCYTCLYPVLSEMHAPTLPDMLKDPGETWSSYISRRQAYAKAMQEQALLAMQSILTLRHE
jgi:hypothetical protein